MGTLTQQKCTACRADAPRVTEAEIAELSPQIPAWEMIEEDGLPKLRRAYSLANYREALAFTQRVGELAEEEGHHPAILTEYRQVTVFWWTHKIRGLHRNDFIMAAKTDQLYAQTGGGAE